MLKLMTIFAILAGLDRIFNNRFGLGDKFQEGLNSLGSLALTIIGIYSLSPLIAKGITPILYPVANLMKTDPSVFIGSFLAPDLGGYFTSLEVSKIKAIGQYNGIILASTLGATISFTIPVAVGLIEENDFVYLAKGVLAGIITIPIGMVVGGIMMGLGFNDIIFSLIPVLIFSALVMIGLLKAKDFTIKIFNIIGKIVISISIFGLILGIIQYMFGVEISKDLIPIEEGAILIFKIGIILSGAYPMFFVISKIFKKYFHIIGRKIGLDEYSILGIFSTLANSIPMLGIYDKMNNKGKVLNAAFMVSGAYAFGGQLGYISSVAPEAVNPFIVSKLLSGILAVILASYILKLEKSRGLINYEH